MLLYADNAVIFAETVLQMALDALSWYCARWKLELNIGKTMIMVFRKAGHLKSNLIFTYHNQELENVTHLGIRFSTTGSFSATQQMLADQARKALFKVYQYRNSFVNNISSIVSMELFDKLISPILCYDSEELGFHTANNVENVHIRYCKSILGVRHST